MLQVELDLRPLVVQSNWTNREQRQRPALILVGVRFSFPSLECNVEKLIQDTNQNTKPRQKSKWILFVVAQVLLSPLIHFIFGILFHSNAYQYAVAISCPELVLVAIATTVVLVVFFAVSREYRPMPFGF